MILILVNIFTLAKSGIPYDVMFFALALYSSSLVNISLEGLYKATLNSMSFGQIELASKPLMFGFITLNTIVVAAAVLLGTTLISTQLFIFMSVLNFTVVLFDINTSIYFSESVIIFKNNEIQINEIKNKDFEDGRITFMVQNQNVSLRTSERNIQTLKNHIEDLQL